MRVLYDHQTFEAQVYGGISRYFTELIRRNPDARLALRYSDNAYLRAEPRFAGGLLAKDYVMDRFLFGLEFRGKRRILDFLREFDRARYADNRELSLEILRRGDFEVFHPTYYDRYFLEALGGQPFVLTVHDMIHEKYPELFSARDATWTDKRELVSRASAVIAISEATKRDLVALYNLDPARVRVIYHGAPTEGPGNRPAEGLPERYVLYTGTRAGYKNFAFFARSIAALLREDRELRLVCIGPEFSPQEREYLRELGILEKVLRRSATEEELISYYRGAICFIFPSYCEGFGIPILEAFSAGCPALLARASCFPEIAGDAALYFDPKDAAELAEATRQVAASASLRSELARRGKARLALFSWDETYRLTAECYGSLA